MDNPKYEKTICVHEEYFTSSHILGYLAHLFHLRDQMNAKDPECALRFCIDTIPVRQLGYIGLRMQWGRSDCVEMVDELKGTIDGNP